MAEIDPLVARVLLKGDDEFLNSLKEIGEKAEGAFEKLKTAAAGGASSFQQAAMGLGLIEAALAGVAAATVLFIEQQTELSQKTTLLADAFGVTTGQLQQLEAVFASSGVKVEQFERFANRLTITIAREWPQIAESIKTYANENDAAQLRVTNATLRVQDAQKALGDHAEERAAQMVKDNLSVEQSYIKLQFAAQHAASEQLGALQSVRGAELSEEAALQRLATLEGRPPSAAEKKNLEIAQAQQAVDTARKATADARLAQQEKAASAALKQAQMEQEYDDLRRKAAKNARDDAEARKKDENALKEAIIQRAEAEQKAEKLALTNIASIRDALDGVVKGNKDAAAAVDLTQVSVKHLTDAIIAQAKEGSKSATPTGYETLIQLSKTLSKATADQITEEQKLAIVNRLAGTSMQALGASAAEILHVLEHDTAELEKFEQAAKALDTKEAKQAIEDFRGALAGLNLTISILSQRFAIAVSPAFTAFLRAVQSSIESNNGIIHEFISGLQAIGSAVSSVSEFLATSLDASLKRLTGGWLDMGSVGKATLIGLGVAIVAATGPVGVLVTAIGLIVIAIGAVRDNWDSIVSHAKAAFDAMKDNSVTRFWERLLDVIAKVKSLLSGGGWQNPAAGAAAAAGGQGGGQGGNVEGHAEGGMIRGPGTGTSDSILARLSNGEFVQNAKAVAFWGADFMHAINNMQMPGFATGGLVAAPVRMGGGAIAPATSTLNLSIDGRSFNGLKGPKSTIDDLSSFAIARQASAAGSNPSWMK